MLTERLPQRGGAQQAADVIGAKRRSAFGGGTHARGLPGKFYSLIDRL
jgi:hypothetical protein